jgi:N-acetylglutamate synthase-like GNAT family acetyltransferase
MEPTEITLKDGATVTLRRATQADGPAVARMHRRCSLDTVFRRYLTAMPQLSPALQARLLDLQLTLVAEHRHEVVGLAHLADAPSGPPELALMVEDAWQRRGVGRLLAEAALRSAEDDGHATVVACTLPSSTAVHSLLRRIRGGRLAPVFSRGEDGLVRVTLRLSPRRRVPHAARLPPALSA